ncbi:MAG TPA: PfkB family carbohydrate kinase, partial [Candidatus Saccharimonadales bacterium]|nr:PfkB family carbohydrate kinase [Candidatus Saccharimonadales bacterium]
LSFIVNKFAKRRGGTAGNVSYTMGLLKTPHTLFSYVGNDFEEYREAFEKIGIDTSHVAVDAAESTATGFAMTDKTNNQIWGYYYGASEKIVSLKLSEVARKEDLVLIGPQGAAGSMSLVRQCLELGISYMFDPGFILTEITKEDLELGITHAAYIIGNEYELEVLKERIPAFSDNIKNKIVITTLGEKGAVIKDKGKVYEISPVGVETVVSTTGAGDAWRGGFLAGLERGYDMKICGQLGAVAGSFAVQHFGTQEHSYTLEDFANRYRQAYGSMISL